MASQARALSTLEAAASSAPTDVGVLYCLALAKVRSLGCQTALLCQWRAV